MGKNSRKRLSDFIEQPLNRAREAVDGLLNPGDEVRENARRAVAALVRSVMAEAPQMPFASALESFRQIWGKTLPPYELDHLTLLVQNAEKVKVEEATVFLAAFTDYERFELEAQLIELAEALDAGEKCDKYLRELGGAFGMTSETFEEQRRTAAERTRKRRKLLRSGAGLLVALIVLGVFILTATLLKSVIFGLMLAWLLLPLEQYFERKLQQKRGFLVAIFGSFSGVTDTLKKAMHSSKKAPPISKLEAVRARHRTLVGRAVSLTCASFLAALLFLAFVLGTLSGDYVDQAKQSVKTWFRAAVVTTQNSVPSAADSARAAEALPDSGTSALSDSPVAANSSPAAGVFAKLESTLEAQRFKFESLPLVRAMIDEVSKTLRDPESQRQLLGLVARKTGGIFSFTAGVVWWICSLLLDLLLTAFFFMLFLTKLAEGRDAGANGGLVHSIFNGSWLPGASDEVVAEADRIVGEVFHKLKVWLRGYLTLVAVDFTVYTTVFFLLGVPYFPILGFVAGCGILLPFLGPIASAALTVIVTLAVEGQAASMMQILGILAIYLVHNGITEQFILYPSVIGESLGLTTLETIIVVLLGGIFAGISGMIFALPAAAVIKYLVPQIYNCWK